MRSGSSGGNRRRGAKLRGFPPVVGLVIGCDIATVAVAPKLAQICPLRGQSSGENLPDLDPLFRPLVEGPQSSLLEGPPTELKRLYSPRPLRLKG